MNTEPTTNYCPKCHALLPPSAPEGLCRKCLLAAVATPTEAGQPANAGAGAAPPLETVAAAFPQLEILELIGSGGMGVVFKARQPRLDRCVALKLLPHSLAADPAFAERFNREARVLARLSHPGIVTVYDFGEAGGFFFLLMEFVDGVNLRQAMHAGRFTPQQAFGLVPKICEALQFAHDEGILHRDIKPENILLDSKGRVKIADFGIAKLVGEQRPVTKLTATGAAIGTPNYMAPEQLEHPEDVDQRADIYSIGVVFYEMLTGELPIGRFAPPSQKSSMDERVDEIVLKALARERELRQQSASEVKTQVENLQTPRSHEASDRPAPASGLAGSAPKTIQFSRASATEGWSHLAIWGAALTGLSLPLPLLLLLAGFLGMGGLGAGELFIGLGCVALLGVPGTLLGWMALSQIRRSHGQLQGLPLALFAALTWPLLVPFLATLLPPLMIATPNPVWWGPALLLLPIAVLILGVWGIRAAARWGSGAALSQEPPRTDQRPTPPGATAGEGSTTVENIDRPAGAPLGKRAPTRVPVALYAGLVLIVLALVLVLSVWLPRLARTSTISRMPTPVDESATVPEAATQDRHGIAARFTVPAGQAAVFEIVTRSNNLTVPIRDLAAYLVAPVERLSQGKFRFTREDQKDNGLRRRPWRIEMETASGTASLAELELPEALEPVNRAMDLALVLQPDQEFVHWGIPDENNPPTNGGVGLRVRTQAHGLKTGMLPGTGAWGTGTNWLRARYAVQPSLPLLMSEQSVSVEVSAPPRETFVVTGIVLSNNVPVSGRELRARLSPPSGRKASPFVVRWQTVKEGAAGTPWEIVVEDKTSDTIAARLRPANLPQLAWTSSPQAEKTAKKTVTREAWAFEVARALQTSGGGNVGAADWSVRLQFQSAPQQTTTSKRGIDASFVLPEHQVAVFEVVTRSNGVVVPIPRLATYVINGADEPYAGQFLWADDPEDLDSQTGMPRWKFGIIGPDGSNLHQGLGVPAAPANYAGSMDLWAALKPDTEVVEGLPDSAPSRPAYGLRIRTQAFKTAPGQSSRSIGQGTNWMGSAATTMAPTTP